LRRSPQSLEADFEHSRSGVLYLRRARPGTSSRRRLDGRRRWVGGLRHEWRGRRLSRCGFGACQTCPGHVVLSSSTRWAPNC
jgi:hypothetical protein